LIAFGTMTDFLPVLLRVIIVAAILFYLVVTGRKGNIQDQKGWRFILAGFTLIFFGLIISILDLFDFTDNFFFLLLTQHQNFLERTVG
jgi:hypothetical protein